MKNYENKVLKKNIEMADYLRIFSTQADYEAYIASDYPKPNVSYIEATGETIYTNYEDGPAGSEYVLDSVKIADFTGTTLDKLTSYITDVNIPDTVTSIGDGAFQNCTSLTSVDIPAGVTTIANSAFYGCTSLASVDIPAGVTSIGISAFLNCRNLTDVTIPNSVTSIGISAFQNCTSLTTTSFWPGSVSTVATATFSNCYSLSNVVLPEGVTTIEHSLRSQEGAFYYCNGIRTVELPSTISSIGGYAFYNCSNITSYTIHATTPPALVGSSAIFGTQNYVIYVPAESVEDYKAASGWSNYASRIQAIPSE